MSATSDRYHALDLLRAFAMFLGIVLHGAMSFVDPPVPFWPVHDPERSQLATIALITIHDFRMQTFFLLGGFFGCLLYQRYGMLGMLKHRFNRIVIPFVLALLLIQPQLQALWLLGDSGAIETSGLDFRFDPARTKTENIFHHFTSGYFLYFLAPLHLWFLYFLVWFYIAMGLVARIGDQFAATNLGQAFDRGFQRILALPGRSLVLAVLLMPFLWLMKHLVIDTVGGWKPIPHVLGYYFCFFLFGWLLYRQRDLLGVFTKRWGWSLGIANLLVLPVMIATTAQGLAMLRDGQPLPDSFLWTKLLALFSGAVYTWLMIPGLMGCFLDCFSTGLAWVRWLADASYWCYLMSLTPIVACQLLLAPVALHGVVKFLLINLVSLALLLATYEWCVRYTIIGAILNGRKYRHTLLGETHRTNSQTLAAPRMAAGPSA